MRLLIDHDLYTRRVHVVITAFDACANYDCTSRFYSEGMGYVVDAVSNMSWAARQRRQLYPESRRSSPHRKE